MKTKLFHYLSRDLNDEPMGTLVIGAGAVLLLLFTLRF